MNELSRLKKPAGSTKKRTRVGRGQASGQGKTAGRGGKGQKARTGNMHFEGFEGGQSPLQRRIPKRGFTNINRISYEIVNLEQLSTFAAGENVDAAKLIAAGFIKDGKKPVKILGAIDEATKLPAITVHAHKFSASAKSKIEAAGGKAEPIAAAQG